MTLKMDTDFWQYSITVVEIHIDRKSPIWHNTTEFGTPDGDNTSFFTKLFGASKN